MASAESVSGPSTLRAPSLLDDDFSSDDLGYGPYGEGDGSGFDLVHLTPPRTTRYMQHRARLAPPSDRAVTQVWAAAGAGKSTLLTLWAAELARTEAVAWVGLGGTDANRLGMSRAIGTAIRLADRPDAAVRVDPVFDRELADRHQPLTIIIDDVHHLTGRAEGDWLTTFITRRPEDVRIVLAGRYPPASLVRLGLLPEVTEIRSADLAFTRPETEEFFHSRSLELSPALLEQVHTRTEGWAAALSLLAGWFRSMPDIVELPPEFVDDHRAVGDYLVNEVLDLLPSDRRRFLLVTSVVDQLTVPLAIHLSGCADAGEILDSLERQTALLTHTLTGERRYTYHATLLSYLRAELRRRDIHAMQHAQRAASEWHRRRGRPDTALELALNVGAPQDVLRRIEEDGVELVFGGHGALVSRALDRLQTSDVDTPITHLLALLVSAPYLPDDAAVDVHLAAAALGDVPLPPVLQLVHCTLRLLRECGGAREPDGVRRDASLRTLDTRVEDALDAATEGGAALAIDAARFAVIARAQVLRMSGAPCESLRLLRLAADQARTSSAWLQLVLLDAAATAAASEGQWAEALDDQDQMASLTVSGHATGDVVSARIQFAVAAATFARGTESPRQRVDELLLRDGARLDPGVAVPARALQLLIDIDEDPGRREHFEELDRLLKRRGPAHRRSLAACAYRYVALALQMHDRHRAIEAQELVAESLGSDSLEAVLTAALIASANGRHAHAESTLLAGVEERSRTWHNSTPTIAWITLAAWAERAGRDAAADARVLRALESAEHLQLRRPFLALGGAGIRLVEARLGRLGSFDDFARSITEAPTRRYQRGAAVSELVAFTTKEREILRELPKHQSVGDIATKQHLSPNTIKTHLRAIYQKLGVSGRSEAVDQAFARGLL
jgi:LuxR family maltose regulon positive regulatory protein